MDTDSGMYFIDGQDVESVLSPAGRAYLVGHLSKPQPDLEHVGTLSTPIEVGTTRYASPTADEPHLHTWNIDINVVLSGRLAVMNLATGERRVLEKGSVCVIEPGTPHACVASTGAQVLFIKTPGGNDKRIVELDSAAKEWVGETLRSIDT